MTEVLPVRATDPDTSREAAEKAVRRRPTVRDHVLKVLIEEGPCTHDQLIAKYNRRSLHEAGWPLSSASSIRTRCNELVREGRVEVSHTASSAMGNRAIVWRAVSVQHKKTVVQ